jgi:hypothetical protein
MQTRGHLFRYCPGMANAAERVVARCDGTDQEQAEYANIWTLCVWAGTGNWRILMARPGAGEDERMDGKRMARTEIAEWVRMKGWTGRRVSMSFSSA